MPEEDKKDLVRRGEEQIGPLSSEKKEEELLKMAEEKFGPLSFWHLREVIRKINRVPHWRDIDATIKTMIMGRLTEMGVEYPPGIEREWIGSTWFSIDPEIRRQIIEYYEKYDQKSDEKMIEKG